MVTTRRTRSHAADPIEQHEVWEAPKQLEEPHTINVSPRRTRSTRTAPASKRQTRSTNKEILPEASVVLPEKRGRPPKKKATTKDIQLASSPRRPLSQISNENTALTPAPEAEAVSPTKFLSTIALTPVTRSPKKLALTPRLAVYKSPRVSPVADADNEVDETQLLQEPEPETVEQVQDKTPIKTTQQLSSPAAEEVAENTISIVHDQAQDEGIEALESRSDTVGEADDPVKEVIVKEAVEDAEVQVETADLSTMRESEQPETQVKVFEPDAVCATIEEVLADAQIQTSISVLPDEHIEEIETNFTIISPRTEPSEVAIAAPTPLLQTPLRTDDIQALLPRSAGQASPIKVDRTPSLALSTPIARLPSPTLSTILSPANQPKVTPVPQKQTSVTRSATLPRRDSDNFLMPSPTVMHALTPNPKLSSAIKNTTWINGVEVALPEDDWSPIKAASPIKAQSASTPKTPSVSQGDVSMSNSYFVAAMEASAALTDVLADVSVLFPDEDRSEESHEGAALLAAPVIISPHKPSPQKLKLEDLLVEELEDDSLVEAIEQALAQEEDSIIIDTTVREVLHRITDQIANECTPDLTLQYQAFAQSAFQAIESVLSPKMQRVIREDMTCNAVESPQSSDSDSVLLSADQLHHVDEVEKLEENTPEEDHALPVQPLLVDSDEQLVAQLQDTAVPLSSSQDEVFPTLSELLGRPAAGDTSVVSEKSANISFSPVKLQQDFAAEALEDLHHEMLEAMSPAAEVLAAPLDSEVMSPVAAAPAVVEKAESPVNVLKRPSSDDSESPRAKRQKSSSRRQSRRQSYMTATITAVREREAELQANRDFQDEADLQAATEFEECLLQEMPGSVERRRTRRSTSMSRSPLSLEVPSPSAMKAQDELLSPDLVEASESSSEADRSATRIQALFRGWRERKQLAIIDDASQDSSVPEASSDRPAAPVETAAEIVRPPSRADNNINDVFSDFLSKWQSKKSQKAKDEIVQQSSPAKAPATPKHAVAGVMSPQKSEKKQVVVAPASAQKPPRPLFESRRSRLPSSKDELRKPMIRMPEPKRAIPVLSKILPAASPVKLNVKRKDVAPIDPKSKRQRLSKPEPVRAKTPMTRPVTPTTPKRLLYLTPAEVTKTTRNFTNQNRLYRCDFERVVVKKEIPRPPSPTAKIQAKMAQNSRVKRRRLAKEKGYTFGAGDEEDYRPAQITPTRRAVKWEEVLEIDLQTLPRNSPSHCSVDPQAVLPCIAPTSLDDFGNTEDNKPLTPIAGSAQRVVITKYLYKGEQDD